MQISLELFTFLEKYYPDNSRKSQKVALVSGSTVTELIKQLGIPDDIQLLFLVNGRQSDKTTNLNENDDVFIFTPAAGG
jgi:sulfur carrier protein ThiS